MIHRDFRRNALMDNKGITYITLMFISSYAFKLFTDAKGFFCMQVIRKTLVKKGMMNH